VPKFFQGLGENTCSLQPALKSNASGHNDQYHFWKLSKSQIQ